MKSLILDLSDEWVKGPRAKTTAKRMVFRGIGDAIAAGSFHKDEGREVAYSSERSRVRLQGPVYRDALGLMHLPLGRQTRVFVVTVRPTMRSESSSSYGRMSSDVSFSLSKSG